MTFRREKILRFVASNPDEYGNLAPLATEFFMEIDELRKDLKDWENDCNQDQQYIKRLQEEIAALQMERDSLQNRVFELESYSGSLAKTNDRLRPALKELIEHSERWASFDVINKMKKLVE